MEFTPDGRELANIVFETKTTAYLHLKLAAKKELKKIVIASVKWENKLKILISEQKKKLVNVGNLLKKHLPILEKKDY